MNMLKRLIYFFYYLKQTTAHRLNHFMNYAVRVSGRSRLSILLDSIYSTFRYNISLLDYFYFRFYSLNRQERFQWVGTGYLYEFQLRMNPKCARELLIDKRRFLQHFRPFIKRSFVTLQELKTNPVLLENLHAGTTGRIVLKGARGQIGAQVKVIAAEGLGYKDIIKRMESGGYDLAEEYVIQHPALMELSSSGLNTVRIITQLHNGHVHFLGVRLRISVNSSVDNMAAGNLAAPVDLETGVVSGSGVYSDITRSDETFHPVSGKAIKGFKIPYWHEVLDLARQAALHTPENKSVGWDIAITPDGPELIEGNHNWCKLLWQLPVKKGLKHELEKFL